MHRVISNKVIIGTWPLSGDFGPIKIKRSNLREIVFYKPIV